MANQLKILFAEDLPSDADLAVLELRKEGLHFDYLRVDSREDFVNALEKFGPDIVISDYMMPSFNGLQALKDTRDFDPLLPFILYTGSINEEIAVECMKAGANDYIIKEHMIRLPFAVKEALLQNSIQKEKRSSELLLKENEEKIQSIFSATPVGIGLVIDRKYIEVNDTFCRMTGYSRSELIGKSSSIMYPTKEEFDKVGFEKYTQMANIGIGSVETRLMRKDRTIINVISTSAPLDNKDLSKGVTFTVLDITERKKAEVELDKANFALRTLIGNLQGLVYRCKNDKDWTMEFLSEGAKDLTGYSPEDLLYNNRISYNGIIHVDDRSSVHAEINESLKNKNQFQITYRIIDATGNLKWVLEKGIGIFSQNNELLYIEGFITDISQRKKLEEALTESQQLFETLAKTSPVGIFRTDMDGYTTYVNPKWEELSGLKLNEALGYEWLKAVHPDDRKRLEVLWNTNINSRSASLDEYRFLKTDGSVKWVMGNAGPEWINNRFNGYVGTVTDISNLKRSEQIQRALYVISSAVVTNNSLEKLIEIIKDQIGTIIDTNNFFVAFYDESSGMISSPFVNDERDSVTSWPAEKSLTGYIIKNNKSLLLKKGNIIDLNTSGKIELIGTMPECFLGVPLAIGEKVNGAFVVQNYETPDAYIQKDLEMLEFIASQISLSIQRQQAIIDLKNALFQAEAAGKLKTSFLNNISHEVRTPLNGILGFAELMSDSGLSEEDRALSITMLRESSDRLLNTITNYVDISLIVSGGVTVIKKDILLVQLLQQLLGKFQTSCSGKKIDMSLFIPENAEKLIVNSDYEILNKIFSHLLYNAIKFTNQGAIQFGYKIVNKELEFFVSDTGIGIKSNSINKIFEQFVKEESSSGMISEGSGLGLSISKGMVELLGGRIWAESERSKGSTFFFSIPFLADTLTTSALNFTTLKKDLKSVKENCTILVAEDDDANFFYINALLNHEFQVVVLHAVNGSEAIIKYIENPKIDLILMDLKMPEVDGFEATRKIKAINPDIPVIALTAYAMSGDETKVYEAGCNGYITKPINKILLFEKIREFISIKPV